MVDAPVVPAEPTVASSLSPAVQEAAASGDFAKYQEAKRADAKAPTLVADPSPAPPVIAPAASTDATPKPASEPAKPRKNADTRVEELLADRAAERQRAERAERELADLRRQQSQPADAKPAGSSPAPAPATNAEFKRYTAMPDAPKLEQFESLEDHAAALALFISDKRYEEREATRTQTERQQQLAQSHEQRKQQFNTRIAEAATADPQFFDALSPDVLGLKPFAALEPGEQATGFNAIAEELLSSPIAPALMRHFSDHPEDLQRMGRLSPRDFLREMGKLEHEVATRAATPPKTVTTAPDPPDTLGTRPGQPADAKHAAIVNGDVRGYRRARLAERVAGTRR